MAGAVCSELEDPCGGLSQSTQTSSEQELLSSDASENNFHPILSTFPDLKRNEGINKTSVRANLCEGDRLVSVVVGTCCQRPHPALLHVCELALFIALSPTLLFSNPTGLHWNFNLLNIISPSPKNLPNELVRLWQNTRRKFTL